MTPEDLEKHIKTLRASRANLQKLRKLAEERASALTDRMAQIEADMATEKSPEDPDQNIQSGP